MTRRRDGGVQVTFRRDLGLLEITMIGLGPTIGTTIFLLVGPGVSFAGPALILVFALNFVVTMFTAMTYMELISAFPETGGGYLWIKKSMAEPFGFLGGWMSWFGHCIVASFYIFSFGVAVVLVLDDLSLRPSFISSDMLMRLLAVAAALVFVYINYRGTRTTGRSASIVVYALVAIVVSFIVFGLVYLFLGRGFEPGAFDPDRFFKGSTPLQQVLSVLAAMGFTFIVFEGYEIIAQCGEECKNPETNIPRALLLCISISTAIFVLVAFVSVGAAGAPQVARWDKDAVAYVASLVMPYGLYLVAFGTALGAVAAMNSLIFSSSRVSFAMGRDNALPRLLGRLHPKTRTPFIAILTSGLIIVIMTMSLDLTTAAASADIMFLLLFLQVNWAAIVLRKKMPEAKRYYVMPLFPVVPIVGIGTKLVLALSLWLIEPQAWFIALGWIGLGLTFNYLYRKEEVRTEVARVVEALVPLSHERYHVLVAIDDFENTPLVEFACTVAKVEDADVLLFNVIEVPTTLPVNAIDPIYVLEVRRQMGRLRRLARDLGVDARASVVVSHDVFSAVMETIKEEESDVLIVGWKGTWRRGMVLGTNIDRFVQQAPSDVVVFKTAGLKEKIDRIMVMNAPEWHVSYATSYAILIAKQHRAKITIFSAVQRDEEMEKEVKYSARLAEICKTHGVAFDQKFVKVRSIVDAVVNEARGYDLVALGASTEWRLTQFAFGAIQDQIARRAQPPVIMVRKVRRSEEIDALTTNPISPTKGE